MAGPLLFSCLRNEGPFLLEWLAWHRHVGFGPVVLFTNDCEDPTAEMAAALDRAGLVTHIPNGGEGEPGPQWRALRHPRLAEALGATEWAMHLDIDEFLMPQDGLSALMAIDTDALAIPWRFFGNAGVDAYADQPVTGQFLRAASYPTVFPRQALMFKSLFRPAAFEKPGVHAPRQHNARKARWANGDGRPMSRHFDPKRPILIGEDAGNTLAQVNHYALKSRESFLVKAARGLPNRQQVAIDLSYWALRNFNDEDDSRMIKHQPAIAAERARLLRKAPTLGALHDAACDWHREKAASILQTPDGAELYAALCVAGDSRTPDHAISRRIYDNYRTAYGSAA